jgi:hypothetical protein
VMLTQDPPLPMFPPSCSSAPDSCPDDEPLSSAGNEHHDHATNSSLLGIPMAALAGQIMERYQSSRQARWTWPVGRKDEYDTTAVIKT